MEPIKNTLQFFMEGLKVKKEAPLNNPEVLLSRVLSKKEHNHVKVKYFRKGILNISVDSSSWLYYLNLKKDSLLESFTREMPQVKDIRFSIGQKDEKERKHSRQ